MVRTLVSVVALCAVVALGGGCASHKAKDREARAKGLKIPTDRSVLGGMAHGKPATGSPAPTHGFVAATPAPAYMPVTPAPMPAAAPMPMSMPGYTFAPAPQFQPVDPTDYAAPRPYASAAPPRLQPAAWSPPRPAPAHFPGGTAGGTRYQVQRGDTLFGIARSRYGNGKRWQEIASANPGLTPATLQAGSTIVVP